MIDGDNDIMFTIKVFEMKFCMDVYEWDGIVWRHLSRVLYETLKL